jgi:hypothetical protein
VRIGVDVKEEEQKRVRIFKKLGVRGVSVDKNEEINAKENFQNSCETGHKNKRCPGVSIALWQ